MASKVGAALPRPIVAANAEARARDLSSIDAGHRQRLPRAFAERGDQAVVADDLMVAGPGGAEADRPAGFIRDQRVALGCADIDAEIVA